VSNVITMLVLCA